MIKQNDFWGRLFFALLGFAASAFLVHWQFRAEAQRTRQKEIKQVLVQLQFLREEAEVNKIRLQDKATLIPVFRIIDMKSEGVEFYERSPFLGLVEKWASAAYAISADNAAVTRARSDTNSLGYLTAEIGAQVQLELLQLVTNSLWAIKQLEFTHMPSTRMEVAFAQTAQRTDVLFELPLDYVTEMRELLEIYRNINRALTELDDIAKDVKPFVGLAKLVAPVSPDIHRVAYWKIELERVLQKIDAERVHRFIRSTDKEIMQLRRYVDD